MSLLQEVAIKQVNDFVRESGGVIKIEDVLPLFPDFVKIDNFKEAICQSLEDYNKQIDQLKNEMEDATRIADALRSVQKPKRSLYALLVLQLAALLQQRHARYSSAS